jgi:hypothetical protein
MLLMRAEDPSRQLLPKQVRRNFHDLLLQLLITVVHTVSPLVVVGTSYAPL